MFQLLLTFSKLNTSLQIGDIVYYSNVTNIGSNTRVSQDVSVAGKIIEIINNDTIKVEVEKQTTIDEINAGLNLYFSFSKDNSVNLSSLKGYYAEVTFTNNSNKKAELFSVGAEIQQSSK
tara:strand:- start:19 stop:378 length:360 start_codon:yes stop_codon:yes gene_type:complete